MTSARAPHDNTSAGFTLIEAVVALALMGVILGALATITAQWLPNWNRGIARAQAHENQLPFTRACVSMLARALFILIIHREWQRD